MRQAAAHIIGSLDEKEQERIGKLLITPLERTTFLLVRPSWDAAELLKDRRLSPALRLDAVRLLQLAMGGQTARSARGKVFEGYSRRQPAPEIPQEVRSVLRDTFPSTQSELDAELARTLAMIEDDSPDTLRKVAGFLGPEAHPVDEIHYLIVLARLTAPRSAEVTHKVADALLDLDRKLSLRKLHRDTNWPLRIAELHAALSARDVILNRRLVEHRDFGRPDHALYTRARAFDRPRAARVFLARAASEPGFAWMPS